MQTEVPLHCSKHKLLRSTVLIFLSYFQPPERSLLVTANTSLAPANKEIFNKNIKNTTPNSKIYSKFAIKTLGHYCMKEEISGTLNTGKTREKKTYNYINGKVMKQEETLNF